MYVYLMTMAMMMMTMMMMIMIDGNDNDGDDGITNDDDVRKAWLNIISSPGNPPFSLCVNIWTALLLIIMMVMMMMGMLMVMMIVLVVVMVIILRWYSDRNIGYIYDENQVPQRWIIFTEELSQTIPPPPLQQKSV